MTKQTRQEPDARDDRDAPTLDTHAGLIDRVFPDGRVRWLDLPPVDGQRHLCVRAGLVEALAAHPDVRRFFRPLVLSVRPWSKPLKNAVSVLVHAKLDPKHVTRIDVNFVRVRVGDMQETQGPEVVEIPLWPEWRAVMNARAEFEAGWFAEVDRSLPRLGALLTTLRLGRWPWLAEDLVDITSRSIMRWVLDLDEPIMAPYELLVPPRSREPTVTVEETGDREETRARAVSAMAELREMVERLDEPLKQVGTRPLHRGEPDALADLGRMLYCHRALGMSPGAIARDLERITAGRRPALATKGQARIRADLKRAIALLDLDPATNRSVSIFGEPTKAKIPD